jgi:hypothetical protein
MTHQLAYHYTPALARSVYRQLLWRSRSELIILTLVVAGVGVYAIWKTDYGVFGAFILGVVASCWYSWWAGLTATTTLAARYQGLTLSVALGEHGCRVESGEATTEFAWSSVSQVYVLEAAIVIVRGTGATGALVPSEHLTPELLSFIREHALRGGAQER